MRISQLSSTSGVRVSPIKYYLREGLLPRGRSLSSTRAAYGEEHVARLRLLSLVLGDRADYAATLRRVLETAPEGHAEPVPQEHHTLHPLAQAAVRSGAWIDPAVDRLYQRGAALIVQADRLALDRSDARARAWTLALQRIATEPYLRSLREAGTEGWDATADY